jgi:hypothetical protein
MDDSSLALQWLSMMSLARFLINLGIEFQTHIPRSYVISNFMLTSATAHGCYLHSSEIKCTT